MTRNLRIGAIVAGAAAAFALACGDAGAPTGLELLSGPAFSTGSGAIWTTTGSCGSPQDVNHYNIGDHVYINGSGFDAGSYAWSITGRPGGASSDPNIVVAAGNITPDSEGKFCFDAYTIPPDDRGEYQVKVGTKGDNYRVLGGPFLEVTKDAATELTRTYSWTIQKTTATTTVTGISPTDEFDHDYSVTVGATFVDGAWTVSGTITVKNTGTETANVTGVADVIDGTLNATVNCGSFPKSLAAGAQFTCSYTYTYANDPGTGTLNNVATATEAALGNFSGNVNFSFASADVTEIDECINLSDNQYSGLAQAVCYTDLTNGSRTINYSIHLGPFGNAVCNGVQFTNTASFVTNDNGATGSSSVTVNISGTCPDAEGCTLTQGYWKTHGPGSKHYDDTWDNFDSETLGGMTYMDILNTPPAGNAWFQLAHQYIAAVLNIANGADGSVLGSALGDAAGLLAGHDPEAKVSKEDKNAFITLAGLLGTFNEGSLTDGPLHCSD